MPNMMAALSNVGGVLCSTPQTLADAHYSSGVPKLTKRSQPLVGRSSPYCKHVWGRYEILLFNKLFPIVDTCLSCEDIARQSCEMVPRRRFFCVIFASCISASRVQHISDLHSKFALRPHHVWKYGRHPISDR